MCGPSGADVVLVADGRPQAVVLLAENPTPAAMQAAEELVWHIEQMSGARLEVINEPAAPPAGMARLLVGDSAANAALGLDAAGWEPEALAVRAGDGVLSVLGSDVTPAGYELYGTLWAAYELLEHLGVRWLWPGETGTVIPQQAQISVPADLDIRFTPPLIQRIIRPIGWNERVQSGLDKLGLDKDEFIANFESGRNWWDRRRNGRQGRMSYGHAFGNYWQRFGEEHPEWFALQPDGSRDQSRVGNRARLCVSNPGLHQQAAADAIEALKENPTLICASISPNDGGASTFCQCDNCKAWDAPEGQIIDTWGPGTRLQHVSLTDRFVKFYNAIADIVAQELPDRYLGAYAYSAYALPPVHEKLRDNIIIGFVGFSYLNEDYRTQSRESWDGWTQSAKHLFFRPNLFMGGMGFPVVYARRMAEDLKHLAATGMTVTDIDTCLSNWALCGLNYYVAARLIWNPALEVEDIVDDYCRSGFGPAAGPVREYFDALEELTDRVAASNEYSSRADAPVLARAYDDEFLTRCNGYLDEAQVLAADDAHILERIAFLRAGLDYARVNRDFFLTREALRAGVGDAAALREAHRQAEEAKMTFLRELGITWAINSAYLQFYGM